MNAPSLLHPILLIVLILVGGIAFFWLVVVRVLAKLHGGDPCPYALAWLVDNPIRRWYMAQILDRIGCFVVLSATHILVASPGSLQLSIKPTSAALSDPRLAGMSDHGYCEGHPTLG